MWMLGNYSLRSAIKNTLVHFTLHHNNSFGVDFEFSERNMLLATSSLEISTVSPNQGNNRYGS